MFKNLKPIFVERSFVPKLLSFFAPIQIGAITLGFIVFARNEMSETTKRHETIHFQQFLERGELMSCSGFRYAIELDNLRTSIF